MPGDTREILLHWEPPFPENRNGIIIGYVVNVTRMNSGEISQLMSTTNSVTVSSLSPFTVYVCAIAATTSVGSGPFSDEITVQTLEEGISPFTCTIGSLLLCNLRFRLQCHKLYRVVPFPCSSKQSPNECQWYCP